MPPKRKIPPSEGSPRAKKSSKSNDRTTQLIADFGNLESLNYTPFQPEQDRPAQANLPPDFPNSPQPIDYFNLFFAPDLFDTIVRNTNVYAGFERLKKEECEGTREWTPLSAPELRVFIGTIIYMGVHIAPNIETYWNTDRSKAPLHTIPLHIPIRRYQQIKRYLHISCSESDRTDGLTEADNKIWWYKLEPLASRIRTASQSVYSPSSTVSIDELMVRCFGRSNHTYKMPSKPIKQGYKLFGIADHGYIYSWVWSSKIFSIEEVESYDSLTNTGALVRALVTTLPRTRITIYLDNYFTSIPLFSSLRSICYGAVGTTRPHALFPTALSKLKKEGKKLDWNTLLGQVVEDILCLAWQDNNIVLALSNVHTVHTVNDFIVRQRKRPAKTSTSGSIVRTVFGDDPIMELRIPVFIDDYNHNIGGVDIANQLREAYETHRATRRNWWPLFYWLIDVVVINSYRLYRVHVKSESPLTHLEFRTALYTTLLSSSLDVKIHRIEAELGTKRAFGNDLPHVHQVSKRTQGTCIWCSVSIRVQKLRGEVCGTIGRSRYGCSFCDVSLCINSNCWSKYHRLE